MKFKNIILLKENKSGLNDFLTLIKIKQGKIEPDSDYFEGEEIKDVTNTHVYIDYEDFENFVKRLSPDSEEYRIKDWDWIRYGNSNIEFEDYYSAKDSFNEGYILSDFTTENLELLKKIIEYMDVSLLECFKDLSNMDWECRQKISETIKKLDDDTIETIVDEWVTARNYAYNEGLTAIADKEIKDVENALGFEPSRGSNYSYRVSIDDLIAMYAQRGETNLSISQILEKQLDRKGLNPIFDGELHESAYNQWTEEMNNTFKYYFDDEIEKVLNRVLEDLESGEYDLETIQKSYKYVQSKGGLDKSINLPNKDYFIKFEKINSDGSIQFSIVEKLTYKMKRGNGFIDDIEPYFSNEELFSPFD